MNAQEKWKRGYNIFMAGLPNTIDYAARRRMERYRREAALERKLAAAQRTIGAQEQRIEELEAVVEYWVSG